MPPFEFATSDFGHKDWERQVEAQGPSSVLPASQPARYICSPLTMREFEVKRMS